MDRMKLLVAVDIGNTLELVETEVDATTVLSDLSVVVGSRSPRLLTAKDNVAYFRWNDLDKGNLSSVVPLKSSTRVETLKRLPAIVAVPGSQSLHDMEQSTGTSHHLFTPAIQTQGPRRSK